MQILDLALGINVYRQEESHILIFITEHQGVLRYSNNTSICLSLLNYMWKNKNMQMLIASKIMFETVRILIFSIQLLQLSCNCSYWVSCKRFWKRIYNKIILKGVYNQMYWFYLKTYFNALMHLALISTKQWYF